MAQARVWFPALLLALGLVGCSGSEYRFGNTQPEARTLTAITVTPGTQTLNSIGAPSQFVASGTFTVSPLTQDMTSQVQWVSSAPSVATVSSTGIATAVGTGTATITATSGGVTGSATLTVDVSGGPPTRTLTSITVIPSAQTLMTVGEPGQFLAIGNYSAAPLTQDMTTQVVWASSDTAVAIVNGAGLATAVSVGTATLTANANGVVGTSTVTVTTNNYSHQLTGLTIIPAFGIQKTNALGETAQYIAIGSFIGDPTTQDMTNKVAWISSDVRVATIDAAGLATAVGSVGGVYPQETTITAMATSNTGATITGTSDLAVGNTGDNNLPSLTVYMFGRGTGTVQSVDPTNGNPDNIINCGSGAGCTGHYVLNSCVFLKATPVQKFGGWSANCSPPVAPNPCVSPFLQPDPTMCSLKLTEQNGTVGAIFNLNP